MMAKAARKNDLLHELLRDADADRLQGALDKNKMVAVRVTESDKAELQWMAESLRLTMSEYLLRLHWFAFERLRDRLAAKRTQQKRK